jgi:hypothetical protein
MINLYQSAINRFQTACFKQYVYPTEEEIREILKLSTEITPVFSNNYHHSIKVFGPEYAEDKKLLCLQTVEPDKIREKYDKKRKAEKDIIDLMPFLDNFIDQIKTKNIKDTGYKGFSKDFLSFNLQVMAPYLLVFKFDPDRFVHKYKNETNKNKKDKALQSMAMHAYAISIIAENHGINSGFCGCFIFSDYNENRVFYNDESVWLFLGLGYKEDWCHKGKNSVDYKERQNDKPFYENIVDWA